MSYVPLEESQRTPMPGSVDIGPARADRVIQVTVSVRAGTERLQSFVTQLGERAAGKRQILTRAQFAADLGATNKDFVMIAQFARFHGIEVVPDHAARALNARPRALRTIELRGTIAAFSRAFRVSLRRFWHPRGVYRGYTGALSVPRAIHGIVLGIFGLDTRPIARPHFRALPPLGGFLPYAGIGGAYTPDEVARLYDFPTGIRGAGQTIAIIELGGGFRRRDLRAYFRRLGIPRPRVFAVPIGPGRNAPSGNPRGADGEVMLDIEVAGAVAPGARIVVYFGPNTNRGFFRAVNTAINDDVNKPNVISISWGGPESTWTAQSMHAFNTAFQAAAAMGVTVCAAAGDSGSSDGVRGRLAHVDFPASSPFVLACGGTELDSDGKGRTSESVWNDKADAGATGGGVSGFFALPHYQKNAKVPHSINPGHRVGRGLPDVAGNASPITGYKVRVDGHNLIIGGTSAVAPLWAGLVALLNESLGRSVGFLNPPLYNKVLTGGGFFDVVTGDNDLRGNIGAYTAAAGWDPCTGLGAPNGKAILNALR